MLRNTITAGLGFLLLFTITQTPTPTPTRHLSTTNQTTTPAQEPSAPAPVEVATVVPAKPAPVKPPKPVANGCEAVYNLATQYTDWSPHVMTRIAQAESGCRFNAVGDGHLTYYNASGKLIGMSCGPWQVRVLDGRPSCAQLQQPQVSVEWAHKIYLSQGLSAWSVCNNGKARCYN